MNTQACETSSVLRGILLHVEEVEVYLPVSEAACGLGVKIRSCQTVHTDPMSCMYPSTKVQHVLFLSGELRIDFGKSSVFGYWGLRSQ